jgi:putative aminopeptidase FrvX
MRKESLEFLISLLETASPSGFESPVQRLWMNYVGEFADETGSDAWGNCHATINPNGTPRILLVGHSDEIGFMVKYISDDGFVYFQGIGGVDAALVRGQRVWVHGRAGKVPGVTGQLAIHLQEQDDRKKVPELHSMFIDIGANNRKQAEKLVRVGDAITYQASVQSLSGNTIAARGCDNRVGIFCAAEGLRMYAQRIKSGKRKLSSAGPCVIAVSTIQEENGLYGASMAGYSLKPEVALVVDVTHATDTPLNDKKKHGDVKLGSGPVISIGSSNHTCVNELLEKVAKKEKIPYQFEINPRWTGTDADAIFLQRGGVPCASLGIPNRYMHTPVEIVNLSDLESMSKLLAAFCLHTKNASQFRVKI